MQLSAPLCAGSPDERDLDEGEAWRTYVGPRLSDAEAQLGPAEHDHGELKGEELSTATASSQQPATHARQTAPRCWLRRAHGNGSE